MRLLRWATLPAAGLMAAVGLVSVQGGSAEAASSFTFPNGPSSPNCGSTVYKADGSAWQCTFDDEFNASRIDTTKWVVPTSFLTGDGSSIYSCTPNDSRVESESSGALHLTAMTVATPVKCNSTLAATNWIAGSVTTAGHFSQTYGRFEARIRAQAGVTGGFNENFWLFPDDRYTVWNWPATGEIDPSQQFSWFPNDTYPEAHYGDGTQVLGTTYQRCAAQRGVWNTYDLIWTATSLTFQVNGQTCFVNTSADPAFTKPFWINLTDGLWLADATTKGPATMDVDYVRVWK